MVVCRSLFLERVDPVEIRAVGSHEARHLGARRLDALGQRNLAERKILDPLDHMPATGRERIERLRKDPAKDFRRPVMAGGKADDLGAQRLGVETAQRKARGQRVDLGPQSGIARHLVGDRMGPHQPDGERAHLALDAGPCGIGEIRGHARPGGDHACERERGQTSERGGAGSLFHRAISSWSHYAEASVPCPPRALPTKVAIVRRAGSLAYCRGQ
jgi:hypothetical protein